MKTEFFPKDKQFWLYHLSAILGLTIYQMIVIFSLFEGNERLFAISRWFSDVTVFTICALLFRKFYLKRKWASVATTRIILISIGYSIVAGIIGHGIVDIINILAFWKDFTKKEFVDWFHQSPLTVVFRLYLSASFEFAGTLCLWIYIYISVTSMRNARIAELNNLKLANSLKEAQLNNLSNQLNPHFLFNALNNIRFMIHENSHHADKMVTSLSDILRYSLESNKKEKVSLHQEIEIIERYIDIVKTQLENRLIFKMDIPESLRSYLLPPMTLQMLVENAIKHGLDNIQKSGILAVAATENSDSIIISVINDLPKNKIDSTENIGIGLHNIDQRLRLLYGERASFMQTKTDTQFIVEIQLPKETEQ